MAEKTPVSEPTNTPPAIAVETQPPSEPPPVTALPEPTTVGLTLWVDQNLPGSLRENIYLPDNISITTRPDQATLRLEIRPDGEAPNPAPSTDWIYAVAAPFSTTIDEIRLSDLRRAWKNRPGGPFQGAPVFVSPETLSVLEAFWGAADPEGVRVIEPDAILETAWQEQPAWAILPFEEIEPRWKVLRLDGQSPLERDFDPSSYPLAVPIRLDGIPAALHRLPANLELPTNRYPEKMTVLVMTGVTALSRHIGMVMEDSGVTYPARTIRDLLVSADLTHISNEVSFYQDCPKPGPLRADMRFCSHPKYIRLLDFVGTDIVELTGNHNLDWGVRPYLDTLEMYRERAWHTYGGGANLEEARRPAFVEHNNNRLVFIGCSPAGPEPVWATPDKPGSAPCQVDDLENQIRQLRAEGYLPIVTLQAFESDIYQPPPAQGAPVFRRLARAGAVIVSGSQSHVPQTMTFVGDSFVHYGLGNLFFDQMFPPEARQQFIDRHVFYNGRYLGVELLTLYLEDIARPRPMTGSERKEFLQEIFSLSIWNSE